MIAKPDLVHLCDLTVELAIPMELGDSPRGRRRIIPIVGGTVTGERLNGRILNLGADWQTILADGNAELDTRYSMETHDGALIDIRNFGYRNGPPEVIAALGRGEGLGGVAVGQVLGTDPDGLGVDVDVVDPARTGSDRHLRRDTLGGADDQHPVQLTGQQGAGPHQRLVVGELGVLGGLALVVAEEGDAVRGVGDHDVLEPGVRDVVDPAEVPAPGQAGREGLGDGARGAAAVHDLQRGVGRADTLGEAAHGVDRVGALAAGEHVDVHAAVLGPGVDRGVRLGQDRDDGRPLRLEPFDDHLADLGPGLGQRGGQVAAQAVAVVEDLGGDATELGQDVSADR